MQVRRWKGVHTPRLGDCCLVDAVWGRPLANKLRHSCWRSAALLLMVLVVEDPLCAYSPGAQNAARYWRSLWQTSKQGILIASINGTAICPAWKQYENPLPLSRWAKRQKPSKPSSPCTKINFRATKCSQVEFNFLQLLLLAPVFFSFFIYWLSTFPAWNFGFGHGLFDDDMVFVQVNGKMRNELASPVAGPLLWYYPPRPTRPLAMQMSMF